VTHACVVEEAAIGRIVGFYTLAVAGIPTPDLPPEQIKRLPRCRWCAWAV
jgi:hypothetical protein